MSIYRALQALLFPWFFLPKIQPRILQELVKKIPVQSEENRLTT